MTNNKKISLYEHFIKENFRHKMMEREVLISYLEKNNFRNIETIFNDNSGYVLSAKLPNVSVKIDIDYANELESVAKAKASIPSRKTQYTINSYFDGNETAYSWIMSVCKELKELNVKIQMQKIAINAKEKYIQKHKKSKIDVKV